jgi:hypothetical protein
VRIRWWRGWLNQEYVAATNILVYLKVELTVRKTFGKRMPHVTTELATNLFRQRRIRISGKDLDAACGAHRIFVIADCRLSIADLKTTSP